MMPVARRCGESNELTLKTRWCYAETLLPGQRRHGQRYREAVKTLEDTERTARRVFGDAHPYASMLDTTY